MDYRTADVLEFSSSLFCQFLPFGIGGSPQWCRPTILEGIITSLKVLKTFFIPSVVGQATEVSLVCARTRVHLPLPVGVANARAGHQLRENSRNSYLR